MTVRYLSLWEVIQLHQKVLQGSGGGTGIRTLSVVESALAQPRATFADAPLYATIFEKAVALGYALIRGHAFIDGNKRVAHAAYETFLMLNSFEIDAGVDEQEQFFLGLAAGTISREEMQSWTERFAIKRT